MKPLRLIDSELQAEIENEIKNAPNQPRISALLLGTADLLIKDHNGVLVSSDTLKALIELNGKQKRLDHGLLIIGAFPLDFYTPNENQNSLEIHDSRRFKLNHMIDLMVDMKQTRNLTPCSWGCHFDHPCRWYCHDNDELSEHAYEKDGLSLRPGAIRHLFECLLGSAGILADRMAKSNNLIDSLGEDLC